MLKRDGPVELHLRSMAAQQHQQAELQRKVFGCLLLLALASARSACGQLQLLADGSNVVATFQALNASSSTRFGGHAPRHLVGQEALPLVKDVQGKHVSQSFSLLLDAACS